MKASSKIVALFIGAASVVPLAGCGDDDTIAVCTDQNFDRYCDDDGSLYDSDSYVVIDGVKQRLYLKEDQPNMDDDDGFGSSSGGTYGG